MKEHEGLMFGLPRTEAKTKLWLLYGNSFQHMIRIDWTQSQYKGDHYDLAYWWKNNSHHNNYVRVGPVEVGKW